MGETANVVGFCAERGPRFASLEGLFEGFGAGIVVGGVVGCEREELKDTKLAPQAQDIP